MSRGADLYHKMDIGDGWRSKRVHPQDSAGNGVVINVGEVSERHPWEKFYGVDSADGSVGKSDYRNIFTSPYFDYRRTHSKASLEFQKAPKCVKYDNFEQFKRRDT